MANKTTSVSIHLRHWANSKNDTMETLILECLPKIWSGEAAQKAYHYSQRILKKRWVKAEKLIFKHPHWAYLYSRNIMKRRWKEAEPYIATCEASSYYYAKFVLKDRFPLYEENFSKDYYICPETNKKTRHRWVTSSYLYLYSKHVSKQRSSRFCENKIKESSVAVDYAINVLKKRWKSAEKNIVKFGHHLIDDYIRFLNLKDRREFRTLLLAQSMAHDENRWYRCSATEWFKMNESSADPVLFS